MEITLKRIVQSDKGTFGVLIKDDLILCYTMERPWDNNNHDTSCIPAGKYNCIPHNTKDHPATWEITNVPNRTAILIHVCNKVSELRGCVGVGRFIQDYCLVSSAVTMDYLHKKLPNDFTLNIINP